MNKDKLDSTIFVHTKHASFVNNKIIVHEANNLDWWSTIKSTNIFCLDTSEINIFWFDVEQHYC